MIPRNHRRWHRSTGRGLRSRQGRAIVGAGFSLPPQGVGQEMGEYGIGQPVRRFEDKRLLSGNGRFQSDNNLLGQAYAYVLRSPHAHARIRKLDLAAAQAAQGVALIMTAADLIEAKVPVISRAFSSAMTA